MQSRFMTNSNPPLRTLPNLQYRGTGLPLCALGVNYMPEIWKAVKGYEGLYEVSDSGIVKALAVRKLFGTTFQNRGEYALNMPLSKYGYKKVVLCKDRHRKDTTVHKVVAQAFIPNPENKIAINHKNGVKTDNRVANLEWCTNDENMRHATETGLILNGQKCHTSKLTPEQVLFIRECKTIYQKDLAVMFSVGIGTIEKIKSRKIWKHLL